MTEFYARRVVRYYRFTFPVLMAYQKALLRSAYDPDYDYSRGMSRGYVKETLQIQCSSLVDLTGASGPYYFDTPGPSISVLYCFNE